MLRFRYLFALLFPLAAGAADQPMVDGVRLGVHKDFTRVVIDFQGKDAPYSVRVSDDGLHISIIAKAGGADGTLPPKRLGLIRDVQWRSVTNGLVVTVLAGTPVAVRSHGALPPDPSSRYYRIYVDLIPGLPPGQLPPDVIETAPEPDPETPAETPPDTEPH